MGEGDHIFFVTRGVESSKGAHENLGQEMQLVTLADYTQAWQSPTCEVCPGILDTVIVMHIQTTTTPHFKGRGGNVESRNPKPSAGTPKVCKVQLAMCRRFVNGSDVQAILRNECDYFQRSHFALSWWKAHHLGV